MITKIQHTKKADKQLKSNDSDFAICILINVKKECSTIEIISITEEHRKLAVNMLDSHINTSIHESFNKFKIIEDGK